MTSLPRFSVNNPILVNLFMIAVLGAGAIAALGLVREMFPESRPSGVSIITPYPGATPSEIEKGITLKIEEQVKDIDGAEKVVSTVSEGLSSIMVELEAGFENVDQAVNDVKSAIDSIPPDDFPEDALESNVSKFDPRLPVISVALYGDVTTRELKRLGEDLRDDLLALPGISKAVLSGTRKDEISVDVHPDKLVEYSLSFMDVAGAIKQSNLDLPGGQIKTSRANLAVRTLGEEDRGEALGDIIIRSDPSGKKVRLSDVATITDGFEDSDIVSRFGGYPAIDVIVFKTADEDAIHIAKLARALVAGKKGEPLQLSLADKVVRAFAGRSAAEQAYDIARNDPYPPGISVEAHTDLSRFIEGRLDLLQRNGVAGLFLVFLSLLVFLHWRVAFWVMMGLTLAVAGSLVCMHLFGQTLNLLTMFGLIVVLGLLVDDAIIVSEHVYTKIEHGTLPKQAAIDGAEEVTWPVVCAIVTTIIAFVPLMFIEGQMGDWMGVLPVIVCIALSVSLLEALTILPSHLAHGLKPLTTIAPDAPMPRGRLMRAIAEVRHAEQNAFTKHLRSVYERLLRLTTRYRYVTIAALFSLLIIAVVGLVGGGHVRFVFLQKMDSETIIANLSMEIGTPAERTTETIMAIEDAAMKVDERKTVFTLVGAQFDEHGGGTLPQSHLAQMWLEIVEAENRTRTSAEITEQLREKTADLSGVDTLRYTAIQGGPGGAAVHIEISSKRLEDIVAVTEEVKKRLGTFDGVYDIADDFDAGRREIQIELLDSATALGLTTESLATQVRAAFYGFEARKIQRGREDVKIMVRFPKKQDSTSTTWRECGSQHRPATWCHSSKWPASPKVPASHRSTGSTSGGPSRSPPMSTMRSSHQTS